MTAMPDLADVFGTEWTRLVAILVRDVGDVGIAEDAAQEAFVEASRRWPTNGAPERPGAWLLTTARRKAVDHIRRSQRFTDRLPQLAQLAELPEDTDDPSSSIDGDLVDEQLAVLLGCCHPALAPDAQVALTLRIVAGLSTAQIARAFLVSESAMTRRLSRSKEKIRAANIPFTRSDLDTLRARLPVVCGVIYSIFTEGHTSVDAASLVRGDLCDEALWLAGLLDTLTPNEPEVAGLLALMLLIDARRATRVDADGVPIVLAHQDRSQWDQSAIARGLAALGRAHASRRGGVYQLQAAIAALHATAPTFSDTDWSAIVRLYDVLLQRNPAALVALNRAIAVAQLKGPAAGLHALDMIPLADDLQGDLADYPYFHAARAELLAELGELAASVAAFNVALDVCHNDAERIHLWRRRDSLVAPTLD